MYVSECSMTVDVIHNGLECKRWRSKADMSKYHLVSFQVVMQGCRVSTMFLKSLITPI